MLSCIIKSKTIHVVDIIGNIVSQVNIDFLLTSYEALCAVKYLDLTRFYCVLAALLMPLMIMASVGAGAQNKFFSTSSRGGAEGAKQNAQMTAFQSEFQRMNACTAAGLVYAPTHVSADSDGCTSDASARSLSDSLSVGGHASVSGTLNVLGTLKVSGEGELCTATLAGAIRYLSAVQVIEYCDGAAWAALGGSAGAATSMVSGWPDALLCTTAGPVQRIYYMQHILSDGRRTYRTDGGGSTYGVIFNSNQTFNSHEGTATTNCNTSIDSIKTAGRAFNFLGGTGSGGGGGGNPQLIADAEACTIAKEGALRWNTGDKVVEFCDGSGWAAFGMGSDFDLVNGLHASSQCTALGGEVVTVTGNVKVCRFSDYQCPSGWIQYQNWSETIQHHANPNCGASCWTTAVAWSNTVKAQCSCPAIGVCGPCEAMGAWHNPAIRKIGCY